MLKYHPRNLINMLLLFFWKYFVEFRIHLLQYGLKRQDFLKSKMKTINEHNEKTRRTKIILHLQKIVICLLYLPRTTTE